jgi:Pyruvate/2-oxoacid:ferredoxin oxidoreductase delta subunit
MWANVLLLIVAAFILSILAMWLIGERGVPLRLSTWRFMREAGLRRNFNLSTLHAYVYTRWIKHYVGLLVYSIMPRLKPSGKKWWADRYHGKVIPNDQAKNIITIDKKIPLTDLEQIIPYQKARNLIINGPPDVVTFECACRANVDEPCQPTQVCMAIGQPFTDFIIDHYPGTSRRLTQTEAVELLQAEHDRGHFHSAWFKDACLDRFYAICNCCKCCCGGLIAMKRYGAPMLASSGYVAQVDKSKCEECTTCEGSCPFRAIQINGNIEVKWESCMGCGVCASQCPNDAIALVRDEKKGIPLDVKALA